MKPGRHNPFAAVARVRAAATELLLLTRSLSEAVVLGANLSPQNNVGI